MPIQLPLSLRTHLVASDCPDQETVDVREAFILWDILASKYFMIQQLQIWNTVTNETTVKRMIEKSRIDIKENIDKYFYRSSCPGCTELLWFMQNHLNKAQQTIMSVKYLKSFYLQKLSNSICL